MHDSSLVISENTLLDGVIDMRGALVLNNQIVNTAGSAQGDGPIDFSKGRLIFTKGADGTTAVTLPALSEAKVGEVVIIYNQDNAVLEVFPASGDKIQPAADDAAISVAAYSGLILFKLNDAAWAGFEPAKIGA
tara:strand:- start:3188 stop:3589 length:402 start_codon:yes stop_codon:yes gene_type:complete